MFNLLLSTSLRWLSISTSTTFFTPRLYERINFPIISMSTLSTDPNQSPRFLGQEEAIGIDVELFNDYKFSLEQLMELAGLSVASAIDAEYSTAKVKQNPVLVICGPGNNGGDGLVAARHLKLFGFQNVQILLTKLPTKNVFQNLLHQATENGVLVSTDVTDFSELKSGKNETVGLIVDALFGFSFKPPVRNDTLPFLSLIITFAKLGIPIVSVDIPSGWDVEEGLPEGSPNYFMPNMLVSLTAPKMCANLFRGDYHYLGGRFVPKKLELKYSLNLPKYHGTSQIVRLVK